MNLRLSRVFMRGVGPASARYDPLLVDFRNGTNEADHAVLWLRNGGGKTTFERLVFHVLAWNDAKNIGKEDKARPGGIEYLLGPDDVGHVVLEWVRADAPDARPLITGLVCQLKQGTGHRRDEDGNLKRSRADVERRFYAFHVHDDVGLDAIADAQVSEGRRLSLRAYSKVLDTLNGTHPRLRIEATASVSEWTTMLEDRGLDGELFRYQVHMNQGEGGADQVIARAATNELFIDFVLRAVTPPGDIADVRAQFERYREELAQMPMLRRRRGYIDELHNTMEHLSLAHEGEQDAEAAAAKAEADARILHGRFQAAAERDTARAAEAAEQQEALRRQRTDADTARKRHNEEAAWLEHWATEQRLDVVTAELLDVGERQAAAQLDAEAWPLTEAVIGRDTNDALVRQLEAALRERDDETAPLRAERDRYAAALRAAHTLAAERHEHARGEAETDATAQKQAAEQHERAATEAERAAATAAVRAQHAQGQLDEATRARTEALTAGLLSRDETSVGAREGALAAASEQSALADKYEDDAALAVREAATAQKAQTAAERDVVAAERREQEAQGALDEHQREHAQVAAMAAVAELVDSPETDLHAAAPVVATALRERISSIESEQRETEGRLAQTRRDLQALADRNLLAPRQEVAQAVEVLKRENVDAMSGFAYLDDAAPTAGRDRLVARHPHIAAGVVLTDPEADIDHALSVLARAGVAPTFPVTVAPADALLVNGTDPGWRVWGGDEALFDRTAAQARRMTLEQDAGRFEARAQELVEVAEEGRQALTALEALQRRWPAVRLEQLRAEAQAAGVAGEEAQGRADDAQANLKRAQDDEDAARQSAKEARRAAAEQAQRAQALAPAAAAELAAAGADERLGHEQELQTKAASEAESHAAAAAACREQRDAALQEAAEQRSAASHARAAAAEVVAVDVEPDPVLMGQPLTVLGEQLALAQRRLDDEVGDDELSAQLNEARNERARHASRLRSAVAATAQRADELAAQPAASTPDERSRQAQLAKEAAERYARRRSQLDREEGALQAQLQRVGRERTQPAQPPSDIDQAEQMRQEALAAAGRQRALGEELANRIAELARLQAAADRDAAVFASLVDQTLEAALGQSPYDQSAEQATADRDADRAKRQALQSEHRRRQQAVDAARRAVGQCLRDPAAESAQDLVDKLARTDDDLLAAHARELTTELASQVALIDERLTGLETDRELIVSFLEPRVADAIARLRALQRTSRLPATLGAWADREFLTIRFDPPGDTARRLALVGKALDELLQGQGSPDGFKLLLHATLTVLGRVRVSVLKPEPGLPSAQPIPVSGLSDLSGGERATIAILLYCALTNLRRETLARADRLAAVSVLLLDNPFGKASSGFLVDQQMQMATALGMQLIYATAIEDANALDRFPVLVRLRNRQDLSRAMRYVRHDGKPATLQSNGDAPTIEAARLVRRDSP